MGGINPRPQPMRSSAVAATIWSETLLQIISSPPDPEAKLNLVGRHIVVEQVVHRDKDALEPAHAAPLAAFPAELGADEGEGAVSEPGLYPTREAQMQGRRCVRHARAEIHEHLV